MTAFNIATRLASGLALTAIALETHDSGRRHLRRGAAKASADKFVRDRIGASKLSSESALHSEIKDFVENVDITDRMHEFGGGVSGYVRGAGTILKRNLPTIGFAALGLIARTRPGRVIALAGMGISMAFDLIMNASNLFERTDYLDN